MSLGHRWNDKDRGNPMSLEINPSNCHFVHHKSHGVRCGRVDTSTGNGT
jgi:hypothetical protein